jgi:hypothetical protein
VNVVDDDVTLYATGASYVRRACGGDGAGEYAEVVCEYDDCDADADADDCDVVGDGVRDIANDFTHI